MVQGTALGRFYGPKNVSKSNPFIIGAAVSGTIVCIGQNVDDFHVGDEVIVIPNESGENGSWATYRRVGQKWILLKPNELTHQQAAAITMASCVGKGAIDRASVKKGDRCLIIGASGAIGLLQIQFLKALGATVTAVCSGKNAELVKKYGAGEVLDYTKLRISESSVTKANPYDIIFDIIGGKDTEKDALKSLKQTGKFVTIVGPVRYIGEKKLSWPKVIQVIGYILWRIISSKFMRGPRYMFGAKFPRLVIRDALSEIVQNSIVMPTEKVISFDLEEIRGAIKLVSSHRARGRIAIDFSLRD